MYVDLEVMRDLNAPAETANIELDTGSDESALARPFLRRLGIRPLGYDWYELADGRRVRRQYGIGFLRLRGEVGPTRVILCGPREAPVLGHVALEMLGLTLDLERRQLRKYLRQIISIRCARAPMA